MRLGLRFELERQSAARGARLAGDGAGVRSAVGQGSDASVRNRHGVLSLDRGADPRRRCDDYGWLTGLYCCSPRLSLVGCQPDQRSAVPSGGRSDGRTHQCIGPQTARAVVSSSMTRLRLQCPRRDVMVNRFDRGCNHPIPPPRAIHRRHDLRASAPERDETRAPAHPSDGAKSCRHPRSTTVSRPIPGRREPRTCHPTTRNEGSIGRSRTGARSSLSTMSGNVARLRKNI